MKRFKFNLKKTLQHFFAEQQHSQTDWYLIGAIWLLVIFGLIMMASAGAAIGWQKYGDVYWSFKHQLINGVLPGLAVFLFFYFFDYQKLKKFAAPMLFISIGLLVLVLIPGVGAVYNGSRAWINIFGLMSIQPSEIVKLTFLLYLAAWLATKEDHHIKDANYGFMPFVLVLSIITVLTVMEPDTGTMIIIVAMSLAVYFVAGASLKHLAWLGAGGVAGLALLVQLKPYRAARLMTFLHPELDPKGVGYHINQALLAIGSGGWLGRGYGQSRQKFAYLPEVTGDSIFAVIGEELGFFICTLVVAVYVFIAVRGLQLAARVDDQFGKLLATGIVVWFTVQAIVNIGGTLGALPMTGVPLPFISYGGTAMIMTLAAAGILANISKQAN